MRSLYTAATGMSAQQLRIDNISNNLANVNTTGFKAARAEFEDLYYEKVRVGSGRTEGGAGRNDSVLVGHGTRTAALRRDFTQGVYTETGKDTDMTILGEGMFAVEGPEGEELYTRVGAFDIDSQGNLVTTHGLRVLPGITVPEGATFAVAEDGVVTATVPGDDPQELGQIQLYGFINPEGLEAMGGGLYRRTDASGEPTTGVPGDPGFGQIRGGGLEGSNVDVARELIDMVLAQRAYELTSKAISTADQMLQVTNDLKR